METAATVIDYVIFALFLLISFMIGSYYAYRGRKNTSQEEYFVGERKIHVFGAAFSAAASAFSGSALVAFPNDSYFRGPGSWFGVLSVNLIESIALCLVFVPVFHRLRLTSIYDYLGIRFNNTVKYYAVCVQVLYTTFHMGINIYVPSLAVSAVTGSNLSVTILMVGITCVIYTAIGGVKAVVWTDVFQAIVIIAGTVALFVLGVPAVGGVGKILSINEEAGRGLTIDFTFDLKLPYTVWSIFFGLLFNSFTRSAVAQYNVQRMLLVKTVKEARITAVTGQLVGAVLLTGYILAGLLMYAYFAGCDPLTNGEIDKQDQLFPLFLARVFKDYPGFIGVMIAVIFGSSLSTASSGINAQAAITHVEVGRLILKDPTPRQAIIFTKLLTLFYGCAIVIVAFLGQFIGGIVDAVFTWSGILIGPVLGVFTLGMFSRRVNSKGALVGMICSTIFGVWLKLGNLYYPRAASDQLPLFTNECNDTQVQWSVEETSMFSVSMTTEGIVPDETEIPVSVYQLSSTFYTTVACITTWLVAIAVSLLTTPFDPSTIDSDVFFFHTECEPKVIDSNIYKPGKIETEMNEIN